MKIDMNHGVIVMTFVFLLSCCGCGQSGSISEKVESSLKAAGYNIMTAEQSYVLTREFLNFTITDPKSGQQYNPSGAIKEDDFKGTFYALSGQLDSQGKGRTVCLRFYPKNEKSRVGTVIFIALNQDVQKIVQVALSQADPKAAAFIIACLAEHQVKRTTSFESSDLRVQIDETHGHGFGLLEIKPPMVRVEFIK
jgi:hypothetical protein